MIWQFGFWVQNICLKLATFRREREKNFLLSKTEKLMNHVINEIDQFDVRRSCYSSATLVQCGRNHITECQYSSHTDPVRYSVTKFCKGSPLWQYFKSICQFFGRLFCIWHNFVKDLGIFYAIEQVNLAIWSHWFAPSVLLGKFFCPDGRKR